MAMVQPPTYHEATNDTLLGSSATLKRRETLVVDYMLSPDGGLDGKAHPALNTQDPKLEFDEQNKKFRGADEIQRIDHAAIFKDAEMEKECFKKAMDDYLAVEKKDPKSKLSFSAVVNVGPDDCLKVILGSITEAQTKYEIEAIKGPWGKVREAFRKLGENSQAFQSWLGLLPSENNYLSVLCGGLKLILGAAATLRRMNAEVVETLCKIPTCLDKCQRLLSIHKSSPKLRAHCSELYSAILRAMGGILEHYRKNAAKRIGLSIIKQSRYGSELSIKLQEIDNCSVAIVEESDTLIKLMAADTNVAARSTYIAVGNLEGKVVTGQQEMTLAVRDLEIAISKKDVTIMEERGKLLNETLKDRDDARKVMAEALKTQALAEQRLREADSAKSKVLSEALGLFNANPLLDEFMKWKANQGTLGVAATVIMESRPGTPLPPPIEEEESRMTKKLLLSLLSYDGMKPKADILANLGHVLRLNVKQQNRVVYVMERLQPFLGAIASSMLLVNGFDNTTQGFHTPLSFVCAKLANALRNVRKANQDDKETPPKIICLSFFCGEYPRWQEDPILANPAGILNCLIVQLITQYKNFDFSKLEEFEKLDYEDIPALCLVFSKLLRQLPVDMVVFCIIERLSEYDDTDRGEGAELLMDSLTKLFRRMAGKRKGCAFKLLVTANRELMLNAAQNLKDDERLNVPENVDSRGGFSALQWDLTVGQDIEELSGLSGRSS